MSEMSDIIKTSLEGIKYFTDMDMIIGNAINTPSGVTVIPVSKITVGFAGGGIDYTAKRSAVSQNFGSGSGTGVSITPVAFLTVGNDSNISLIPISDNSSGIDRIVSLVERSPDIVQKIKDILV